MDFGETLTVALDIWKLWSLKYSCGFYSSICSFILSFVFDYSIATVVDGDCSSKSKSLGSVLWTTHFLSFIDGLLDQTSLIHFYDDNATLHFSTSFQRRPTLQEANRSRRDAPKYWPSHLSKIFDWAGKNQYYSMPQKINFSIYQLSRTFQTTIPLSLNAIKLSVYCFHLIISLCPSLII